MQRERDLKLVNKNWNIIFVKTVLTRRVWWLERQFSYILARVQSGGPRDPREVSSFSVKSSQPPHHNSMELEKTTREGTFFHYSFMQTASSGFKAEATSFL